MKILYHHRTQGKRAEGVHIREIVNALRELSNEVYIVSPPGVDIFQEAIGIAKTNKQSILSNIWVLISKKFPQIGFELLEIGYNLIALKNIHRIFKKSKIDFIYERHAFFCWAGVCSAKKHKVPIILEVNEISGIKRARGQILMGIAKWIEVRNFRDAKAIIVVSKFLKEQIVKMGINSNKVFIMPNAVNIKDFTLDQKGILVREKLNLNEKTTLGFVGNFSWWDNLSFLIEVFSELTQTDAKLHLLLIGEGKETLELKNLAKIKNLGSSITFTGKIDREDIPEYISALDICIIPDSNYFGSPMVLFEYMAMAKPVIAPRLPPIEDVIVDNLNGILFEPKNKESFRGRLTHLIYKKEERNRLGEEARKTILSGHLWRHNAEKIIAMCIN